MRESRSMLAQIRATLAVQPTTQWTVANADYAGTKLRALVQRELSVMAPHKGMGDAGGGIDEDEDMDASEGGRRTTSGAEAVKVRSKAFWGRFRGGRTSPDADAAAASRSSAPPWCVVAQCLDARVVWCDGTAAGDLTCIASRLPTVPHHACFAHTRCGAGS